MNQQNKVKNYWTVLAHISGNKCFAICECGVERIVRTERLIKNTSKSCGCMKSQFLRDVNLVHGFGCDSKEYRTWVAIRNRCNNKTNYAYKHYGGRGIKVSKKWDSFEQFYIDMGNAPSPKHSIDRIDNNGDYSKSNCRWATKYQQSLNRRTTRNITFKGKTMCIREWEKEMGVGRSTIQTRLMKGWSIKRALTTKGLKNKRSKSWDLK